jgi:hypothetical protein
MSNQPIFAEVRLRHRGAGHLRFQIPEILSRKDIALYLEQGLHQLEGVRRVVVYSDQRKLSIFYMENVCDVYQVVRKLARLIALLVDRGFVTPEGKAVPPTWKDRLKARFASVRAGGSVRARITRWREQAKMAKNLLNAQWKVNPALRMLGDNPEKAAYGFFNDIVTFYLIKVHWDLILGKWLKSPLRYRYEWLTVFYFVFLLVRSRKQ